MSVNADEMLRVARTGGLHDWSSVQMSQYGSYLAVQRKPWIIDVDVPLRPGKTKRQKKREKAHLPECAGQKKKAE